MPNWCFNALNITGPEPELIRFRDSVRDGEMPLSFNKLVPLSEDNAQCAWDTWGTKWELDKDTTFEEVDGGLSYMFDTAWGPPNSWLFTVGKLFPELFFSLVYEEGGNCAYGKIEVSDGEPDWEEYTKADYTERFSAEFAAAVEAIEELSQEELIKYFAGQNFEEVLDYDSEIEVPGTIEDGYDHLAKTIIACIEPQNLPLFVNVDWGAPEYNTLFKERLQKGV